MDEITFDLIESANTTEALMVHADVVLTADDDRLTQAFEQKKRQLDAAKELEVKKALRKRLFEEIATFQDGDSLLLKAYDFQQATAAGELYSLRLDVMHAFGTKYKELSGRKMLKAELEGLFPESKQPKQGKALAQLPMTEFGVTERMLQMHGKELAYASDSGRWYRYSHGYWQEQPLKPVAVRQMAREIVKTFRPIAEAIVDVELQEQALRAVESCERTSFAGGVVEGLAGETGITRHSLDFDTTPHLLTAKNGLIDLRTGELLPHDPEHLSTMVTGCDYVKTAECPWFIRTLSECLQGSNETVGFLRRFLGYSILGNPCERHMLLPIGKGKDGKSTIFNAIRDALGTHAAVMNSTAIVSPAGAPPQDNAGGPAEHLLRLKGKRFVLGSEIKRSSTFKDDVVKTLLSGGDTMTVRGLFSTSSVEFKPSSVFINPANVVPRIVDDDPAIMDRLLMIRFSGHLRADESKVDTTRPKKLAAEAEGILAWLVAGALEYQEHGLAIPDEVKRVKREVLEGASPIQRFIEDCCEVGDEFAVAVSDLFNAWKVHSYEQGEKNLAQTDIGFGRYIMANVGVEQARPYVDGTQQRVYLGIKLKGKGLKLKPDFWDKRKQGTIEES